MNVVILQPSYIPWRGYFDLIRKSDLFIFYDDVQYDKRGWRNRNQIKTPRGKQWLTIPVFSRGSQTENISINQIKVVWENPWNQDHLKAFHHSYAKAPYFEKYVPLLNELYNRHDDYLADFTIESTIALARELGIAHTRFMRSSEIPGITGQKTDRLIEILQAVGATHYISGPSAKDYIENDKFDAAGITLEYMEYNYPEYPQLHPPYDPFVTIFDLLFMTGSEAPNYIFKGKHD
jgi:hypothetical protein